MEQIKSLFHYTSLYTFLVYILPTQELKFSKLMNSRDPYEYKRPIHHNVQFTILRTGKDDRPFYKNMEILMNAQRICFLKERDSKRFAYAKPRMWEQYGNNHEGVCIKLDENKFLNQIHKALLEKSLDLNKLKAEDVEYLDIASDFNRDFVKEYAVSIEYPQVVDYCKTHYKMHFFTKDKDYQNEDEFRYVYLDIENIVEDLVISLEDSVTSLYFGEKVPKDTLDFYKDKIHSSFPNAKLSMLSWENGGCCSTTLL